MDRHTTAATYSSLKAVLILQLSFFSHAAVYVDLSKLIIQIQHSSVEICNMKIKSASSLGAKLWF